MDKIVAPESWVEIHRIVLTPEERAPKIPEDTSRVPLEMRVKGFLVKEASLGEEVEIITPIGRKMKGTLLKVNPAFGHDFGAPVPELLAIGRELKELLDKGGCD